LWRHFESEDFLKNLRLNFLGVGTPSLSKVSASTGNSDYAVASYWYCWKPFYKCMISFVCIWKILRGWAPPQRASLITVNSYSLIFFLFKKIAGHWPLVTTGYNSNGWKYLLVILFLLRVIMFNLIHIVVKSNIFFFIWLKSLYFYNLYNKYKFSYKQFVIQVFIKII